MRLRQTQKTAGLVERLYVAFLVACPAPLLRTPVQCAAQLISLHPILHMETGELAGQEVLMHVLTEGVRQAATDKLKPEVYVHCAKKTHYPFLPSQSEVKSD